MTKASRGPRRAECRAAVSGVQTIRSAREQWSAWACETNTVPGAQRASRYTPAAGTNSPCGVTWSRESWRSAIGPGQDTFRASGAAALLLPLRAHQLRQPFAACRAVDQCREAFLACFLSLRAHDEVCRDAAIARRLSTEEFPGGAVGPESTLHRRVERSRLL